VLGGAAAFRCDFFVVPDAAYEYVLGSDWQAQHEWVPNLKRGFGTIPVLAGQRLPGGRVPNLPPWAPAHWRPRLKLPIYYKGQQLKLAAKDMGCA
jgi:hypothetical protein